MDISKLSTKFQVRKLEEHDIDSILELCLGNPMFYQHCPPVATKESIARDMAALPPKMTYDDKYYLGFYDGTDLIAVMDLILNYPNEQTAFIGFFMVSSKRQKQGLGSVLIRDIIECLYANGYEYTRLAYVKGNPQSRVFWLKNGFTETGVESNTEDYTLVILQRSNRCYYKAYDDRYKIIHEQNHTWATETPTPIVLETLQKYNISKAAPLLEVGCGEGRDSIAILNEAYHLTASDVSPEAIRYCKEKFPAFESCFKVIDACQDNLNQEYDFIFATSVLHMLVNDTDRNAFLKFFYNHLSKNSKALILTMGDGFYEFSTDSNTAYEIQERSNNASNLPVLVTNTSCRVVSFETLEQELKNAGLHVLEKEITQSLPDFDSLMYVVVSKEN